MSDMTVARADLVGMLTLRGALDVLAPALSAEDLPVPDRRMRAAVGDRAVLWMAPDELLVTCPAADARALADRLTASLGDAFATVAVVSDARAVFDLYGQGARSALASLCPVDFDRLAQAEVRRTRMAQVAAALWREGEGWRVVCFRSVGDYVEGLLRNAAA